MTEWLTVIGGAIAILGFLGYNSIKNLIPIGPLNNEIIGQWQATDRPFHLELRSSGNCEMSTIGSPTSCTFRIMDNVLYIDTQNGGRFKAAARMLGHDRLELRDPDGSTTIFNRI